MVFKFIYLNLKLCLYNEIFKKFNESNSTYNEFKYVLDQIKGSWESKNNIGECNEELAKELIDKMAYSKSLVSNGLFGKRLDIIHFLKYSLEYSRLNLAKYIINKYKSIIKSDDIDLISDWIRNSEKMNASTKKECLRLIEHRSKWWSNSLSE